MNIEPKDIISRTILTPTRGQLSNYTHSLNPFGGCAFGCSYCYVRQLPVSLFRDEEWGTWIDVKTNAAELLYKELKKAKKKGPIRIFMSSATDPYQPIEHKLELTRSLLKVMLEEKPDFLFVQTRSPLVVRDIDLLKQFGSNTRVSITIETDKEEVRKAFSPAAPPIPARMRALREITEAGILTQATIAPLLPCSKEFPIKLKNLASRVTLDDFWMGDGSGGKRTDKLGVKEIYEKMGMEKWYDPRVVQVIYNMLKEEIDQKDIGISQKGFSPN
ncbi:SPL family radical SAM protein [Litchfieldia alkalitelluris]|uniref:SPL family radical SAM protein n=1 Tax=Litchfieldia alkalitelluris TaxID=304268 RepID=UPI000996311C|nr:radical SAM protein [Litchfieldia alkalitelluris]